MPRDLERPALTNDAVADELFRVLKNFIEQENFALARYVRKEIREKDAVQLSQMAALEQRIARLEARARKG